MQVLNKLYDEEREKKLKLSNEIIKKINLEDLIKDV